MTPDASGWRSSERYAHVADMTASDVAWEWLRRNETYDRDFQALGDSESDLRTLTDGIGQRWGCDFPVDPMQAPPEAQVIWLPQEDTSAIVLGPPPDIPSASADPQPTIDAAVSVDVGSETHLVLDLGNGQRVALVHPSETRPAKSLGAFIPLGLEGFDRLQSVARLLSALHGRAIPPDTRLTRQQRARLCRMLQAFDGHRAGATQQEIAQVIFRIGALGRDDWQASSARHATKALLRDARAMMVGGYRTLLRHRRQL